MKNYFLLALCASLFFAGCEKDDGFRTVMIEVEMDAIPFAIDTLVGENFVYFQVALFSPDSGDELLRLGGFGEQGDQSQTYKSDEIAFAVGSNVSRFFELEGGLDTNYSSLPCDVTLRIKADNKVIWSHMGKKGDDYFTEQSNLIIR